MNIPKNTKAIKEALTNNCFYVYLNGTNRVYNAKMINRKLKVLTTYWHTVEVTDTLESK